MRPHSSWFLTAAILLGSASLWAQEPYHSSDPDLLARLSYDHSAVVHEGGVEHICVAVSRDGDYWVVRSLKLRQTQRRQGKLSPDQFQQLKKLLGSAAFQALSGNHGALIRQDSESFGAEVSIPVSPQKDGTVRSQRLQWLNADGENPFPPSAAEVVNWLRHFEPAIGKTFEYAEYPDVCPSSGLRFIQPTVAENLHPQK